MGDTYILWTHGVNVKVEYTREYTGHDNGLYLRRAGWGAEVRQKQGTDNWFHFPIPSATLLDNRRAYLYHAYLRVRVNNHAVIDRIHIRQAEGPEGDCPIVYDTGPINITGQNTERDFNIRDRVCRGPVIMCVHVRFDEPDGEVIFVAAGAHFEEGGRAEV